MPVDSLRKRASIVTVATPWYGPGVIADGSFDQGDRQQIGWSYYGINADPPSAAPDVRPMVTLLFLTRITDNKGFLRLTQESES